MINHQTFDVFVFDVFVHTHTHTHTHTHRETHRHIYIYKYIYVSVCVCVCVVCVCVCVKDIKIFCNAANSPSCLQLGRYTKINYEALIKGLDMKKKML